MSDESFMREALAEARKAADEGEVPVGAVVVLGGEVIGRGHNRREAHQNPLAHAELEAIAQAASALKQLATYRLHVSMRRWSLAPCARGPW